MKAFLALILSCFLLSSCATTHPGNLGSSNGKANFPLKMSARTIDFEVDSPFQLVEFTFENTSKDWLKLTNTKVVIDNPTASKVSVVLGNDLLSWAEAVQAKNQKDNYNKEIWQTGLFGLGTIGALSGNKDAAVAGVAVMIGTSIWAATDAYAGKYKTATGVDTKPKSHLYEDMSIPGTMFFRRWVLLNKPAGTAVKKIILQLEDVNNNRGLYEVEPSL